MSNEIRELAEKMSALTGASVNYCEAILRGMINQAGENVRGKRN